MPLYIHENLLPHPITKDLLTNIKGIKYDNGYFTIPNINDAIRIIFPSYYPYLLLWGGIRSRVINKNAIHNVISMILHVFGGKSLELNDFKEKTDTPFSLRIDKFSTFSMALVIHCIAADILHSNSDIQKEKIKRYNKFIEIVDNQIQNISDAPHKELLKVLLKIICAHCNEFMIACGVPITQGSSTAKATKVQLSNDIHMQFLLHTIWLVNMHPFLPNTYSISSEFFNPSWLVFDANGFIDTKKIYHNIGKLAMSIGFDCKIPIQSIIYTSTQMILAYYYQYILRYTQIAKIEPHIINAVSCMHDVACEFTKFLTRHLPYQFSLEAQGIEKAYSRYISVLAKSRDIFISDNYIDQSDKFAKELNEKQNMEFTKICPSIKFLIKQISKLLEIPRCYSHSILMFSDLPLANTLSNNTLKCYEHDRYDFITYYTVFFTHRVLFSIYNEAFNVNNSLFDEIFITNTPLMIGLITHCVVSLIIIHVKNINDKKTQSNTEANNKYDELFERLVVFINNILLVLKSNMLRFDYSMTNIDIIDLLDMWYTSYRLAKENGYNEIAILLEDAIRNICGAMISSNLTHQVGSVNVSFVHKVAKSIYEILLSQEITQINNVSTLNLLQYFVQSFVYNASRLARDLTLPLTHEIIKPEYSNNNTLPNTNLSMMKQSVNSENIFRELCKIDIVKLSINTLYACKEKTSQIQCLVDAASEYRNINKRTSTHLLTTIKDIGITAMIYISFLHRIMPCFNLPFDKAIEYITKTTQEHSIEKYPENEMLQYNKEKSYTNIIASDDNRQLMLLYENIAKEIQYSKYGLTHNTQ